MKRRKWPASGARSGSERARCAHGERHVGLLEGCKTITQNYRHAFAGEGSGGGAGSLIMTVAIFLLMLSAASCQHTGTPPHPRVCNPSTRVSHKSSRRLLSPMLAFFTHTLPLPPTSTCAPKSKKKMLRVPSWEVGVTFAFRKSSGSSFPLCEPTSVQKGRGTHT